MNNWYLKCNECEFRLPDQTAAKPVCPDCGAPLHLYDYYEPEEPEDEV